MYSYNLTVGPVVIGLQFEKEHEARAFSLYFNRPHSEVNPDLKLKMRFTSKRDFTTIPNSLFLTKKLTSDGFICGDGLIHGHYDRVSRRGDLLIHNLFLESNFPRVLEQIIYQAFNSVAPENHFLVHSSGVIRNGEAFLFVGPSESGKSTVAELSRKYHVINDEITLFSINSGNVYLEDTPFNGLFPDKKPGKAPLKGIYLLNQAREHKITPVSGSRIIRLIAGELIPSIGLDEVLTNTSFFDQIDRATKMSRNCPVYRMDFLKDDGFWKILSLDSDNTV